MTTATKPRIIHVAIELDQEFLRDVLSTAICGGITYWADITEHTEDLCEIAPKESPDDFESQALSIDHMAIGIRHALEKDSCAMHIRKAITNAVQYKDAGCIDADCADVIAQLAVFEKIVFS